MTTNGLPISELTNALHAGRNNGYSSVCLLYRVICNNDFDTCSTNESMATVKWADVLYGHS